MATLLIYIPAAAAPATTDVDNAVLEAVLGGADVAAATGAPAVGGG